MVMLKPAACVNLQDRHGRTPLHAAVVGGHTQTVQCLVQHGADVDVKADSGLDNGRTPLHLAALSGQPEIAQLLLSHGACVNIQDGSGHAPLHLAAMQGQVTIVGCLVEAGGNCDLQDAGGKTPLHTCFDEEGPSEQQREAAILLVPNSNLHLVDRKGRLALHLAALWDCGEVIEFMLTRDIDMNVRDIDGNTPLHYAFLNDAAINMAAARVLLGHGVDLQLTDGSWHSPIHALMKHRRCSDPEVKEMVRDWAQLRLPAEFGSSLLHLASIGGNTDVARFLLACGVDSNMADNLGRCPLHLAAIGGRLDLLRVLMKNGADVNKQDDEGASPLHYAAELPRTIAVKMLLREGAQLDMRDHLGQGALHRAAGWGALDTVRHLVAVGADMTVQNEDGLQPLHLAAREDQEEVAEFLITKGANVECGDPAGKTPLHLASAEGHCDVIKALYVNDGDVNKAESHGWTPLHFACYHGKANAVQTLLNRSANATIRDNKGKSPEDVAVEHKHDKVLRVLRQFQKSFVLYAKEQLPLVTDSPEEVLQRYQQKHAPPLPCLRPLVSVETLPDDDDDIMDVTSEPDKLSQVAEDGEHVHLLEATCVSEPQHEVELQAVNNNKPGKERRLVGDRHSACDCCKVS